MAHDSSMIAVDLEEGRRHPAMQRRQHRIADQLVVKGQDRGQLVPAPVELDAQKLDIGHAFTRARSAASRRCLTTCTGSGRGASCLAPPRLRR
jgi:hypothetical protein